MAEGLPAEAVPDPAEYQAALQHFFETTAASLHSGNVWLEWAERSQIVDPATTAGYRANLMQQANASTLCARDIIVGCQQAGMTVWVNHADYGPSLLEGVQYNLGQPHYH